jgi:hypothetical protein
MCTETEYPLGYGCLVRTCMFFETLNEVFVAQLRVWDVMATPSTAGVGTCVGTTKGAFDGMPVGLKSVGPICYIGAGYTVKAVDLRTMCTVATVSSHKPSVLTFAVSPSGTSMCTGGSDKYVSIF